MHVHADLCSCEHIPLWFVYESCMQLYTVSSSFRAQHGCVHMPLPHSLYNWPGACARSMHSQPTCKTIAV